MYSLRIITFDSPGLKNDAETYKKVFEQNNYSVDIAILYSDNQSIIQPKYDINLFLERISPKKFKTVFPSTLNLLMPNQEIFGSYDELKYMDYILCKSEAARSFFEYMKKEKNYKYICFYTKFTTNIPESLKHIELHKNVNLFVHLAGKSSFKNTDSLIYCWLTNNGFLDIDPEIELYVTCYKNCFKQMKDNLKKYFKYNTNYFSGPQNDVIRIKNMVFYTTHAPLDEYNKMLTSANVALCISSKEGFGHYINEARFFETFVVILDAEPMNELVIDNVNGLVIKDPTLLEKDLSQHTSYKMYSAYPKIEDLKKAIIYCIKNKKELHTMGKNGRKMFINDEKFFIKTMTEIILNDLNNNISVVNRINI